MQNDLVLTQLPGYGSRSIQWHLAQVENECSLQFHAPTDTDTLDVQCATVEHALAILREDHRELLNKIIENIKSGILKWWW